MKREIKFRACLKNSSEIYEVMSFCKEYVKVYTDITEKGYTKLSIDNFEPLMQFTGLKDKNGKEIYEGDILKNTTGKIDQVIWMENGFYGSSKHFSNKNVKIFNPLCKDYLANKEVSGNIYENPELV